MKSNLPLTEQILIKIGMKKPGHRRRLLVALDSLCNNEECEGILQEFKCCFALPNGLWSNNIITMEHWLRDLNLTELETIFTEAGFEEVEDITKLMDTPWAIDENLLLDIGIEKPGYRHRILAKLRGNHLERKTEELIIEKNSNSSACALCSIM